MRIGDGSEVSVSFCTRRGGVCRVLLQTIMRALRKLQMQKTVHRGGFRGAGEQSLAQSSTPTTYLGSLAPLITLIKFLKRPRCSRLWSAVFAVRMRVQLRVAEINAKSDKNRLPQSNDTRRNVSRFPILTYRDCRADPC
ncbi:hypothetical protein DD238_007665 [Peronospora effusa]|uniref:Uncharacterized protein n=1 Tax=Peronospora effusa TaxID=542832 RepID=A0A3M6VUT2_9STRA|nr:hypothetical protein DD238_007665 [Peronospora effusa]